MHSPPDRSRPWQEGHAILFSSISSCYLVHCTIPLLSATLQAKVRLSPRLTVDSSEGSASNLGCRVSSRSVKTGRRRMSTCRKRVRTDRGKSGTGRRRAPLLRVDCRHQSIEEEIVDHGFLSQNLLAPTVCSTVSCVWRAQYTPTDKNKDPCVSLLVSVLRV